HWIGFSPDGQSLAAADGYGTVKVWTAAGKDHLRLTTTPGRNTPAFTPDGADLALGRPDGTPAVIEVATGRVIREFRAAFPTAGCWARGANTPSASGTRTTRGKPRSCWASGCWRAAAGPPPSPRTGVTCWRRATAASSTSSACRRRASRSRTR